MHNEKLAAYLKEMTELANFSCTELQLSLALATIHNAPIIGKPGTQIKNQMLVIPAAKGKTRIAMAIALGMSKKYPSLKKVVVVYLNSLLMEQDQENWNKLHATTKAKIIRVVGLEAGVRNCDKSSIMIVDEADKIFIDELQDVPKQLKCLIGLTASVPEKRGQEGGFIHERLEHIGFHLVIKEPKFTFKPKSFTTQQIDSFEAFFETSTRCAKLVFANEEKHDKIEKLAQENGWQVGINTEDLRIIRNMKGWCIIVSKEWLMRGIDYRIGVDKGTKLGPDDGIDLLVAKEFSNERALLQGYARVGRYTEPCTRYVMN